MIEVRIDLMLLAQNDDAADRVLRVLRVLHSDACSIHMNERSREVYPPREEAR